MKHQWVRFGEDRDNPFQRLRWCSLCGKVQIWSSDSWYMRIVSRHWWPKVGRCTGVGAKTKRLPKGRMGDIEAWNIRP